MRTIASPRKASTAASRVWGAAVAAAWAGSTRTDGPGVSAAIIDFFLGVRQDASAAGRVNGLGTREMQKRYLPDGSCGIQSGYSHLTSASEPNSSATSS